MGDFTSPRLRFWESRPPTPGLGHTWPISRGGLLRLAAACKPPLIVTPPEGVHPPWNFCGHGTVPLCADTGTTNHIWPRSTCDVAGQQSSGVLFSCLLIHLKSHAWLVAPHWAAQLQTVPVHAGSCPQVVPPAAQGWGPPALPDSGSLTRRGGEGNKPATAWRIVGPSPPRISPRPQESPGSPPSP